MPSFSPQAALAATRQFIDRARWAGDLRTLRHFYRTTEGPQRLSIRFGGDRVPFWVRGGTLDAQVASQIIRDDSECRLPVESEPSVIFDVGANIGAASVYFALRYPNARVFAFEPLPEHLDVLHRNLEPFGERATIVPMGLGDRPGMFPYRYADDPLTFGGGMLQRADHAPRPVRLPTTTIADVCRTSGIDRIDVLKVGTSGADLALLRGMPRAMLGRVEVVVGTLRGDDAWPVCQLLERSHDVGLSKRLGEVRHSFVAVRRPQPVASYRLAEAA